jgi:uncharacterized protein
MKQFRSRILHENLALAMQVMPVVAVTGARQTGKTTLVQECVSDLPYITLDDIEALEQAETNPQALLAAHPLVLDEVQRAPSLLLAIKKAVDKNRKPGTFVLTGSANLLLMKGVSESLAGRATYLELPPFCPTEWNGGKNPLQPLDALWADEFNPTKEWPQVEGDFPFWLLRGGFPSALELESDEARALWYSAYTQTYLERDLRQLSAVSSLADFQRLMRLAAQRTSRLINQAELARDAALSHPTAHRYINLLETGCLIHRLQPYASNLTTSIIKTPKLLWADCGLAAWLAGINNSNALKQRDDIGFWLEQAIFQTLQVWRTSQASRRRIYFWRDKLNNEVDFLLEQDGELVAIEIKSANRATQADTKGISALKESLKKKKLLKRSIVLHSGSSGNALGDEVYGLPWGWMMPG